MGFIATNHSTNMFIYTATKMGFIPTNMFFYTATKMGFIPTNMFIHMATKPHPLWLPPSPSLPLLLQNPTKPTSSLPHNPFPITLLQPMDLMTDSVERPI